MHLTNKAALRQRKEKTSAKKKKQINSGVKTMQQPTDAVQQHKTNVTRRGKDASTECERPVTAIRSETTPQQASATIAMSQSQRRSK